MEKDIQEAMDELQQRIDKLEKRIAMLESAVATHREDAQARLMDLESESVTHDSRIAGLEASRS